MKEDAEGKRERKKHVAKKYTKGIIVWLFFTIIVNVELLPDEIELFLNNFIEMAMFGIIVECALGIGEYIKLEKKVKEINK